MECSCRIYRRYGLDYHQAYNGKNRISGRRGVAGCSRMDGESRVGTSDEQNGGGNAYKETSLQGTLAGYRGLQNTGNEVGGVLERHPQLSIELH